MENLSESTKGNNANTLLCVGFSFVMPFGKYKNKTLFDISEENPSYIKWLDEKGIYKIEDDLLIKCLVNTMSPDFEDLHSDWGCRD